MPITRRGGAEVRGVSREGCEHDTRTASITGYIIPEMVRVHVMLDVAIGKVDFESWDFVGFL